jgi:hypothetical protein
LFRKLKKEVRRKPIEVALDRLDERAGLHSIERGQVVTQHDPLAQEGVDA